MAHPPVPKPAAPTRRQRAPKLQAAKAPPSNRKTAAETRRQRAPKALPVGREVAASGVRGRASAGDAAASLASGGELTGVAGALWDAVERLCSELAPLRFAVPVTH